MKKVNLYSYTSVEDFFCSFVECFPFLNFFILSASGDNCN